MPCTTASLRSNMHSRSSALKKREFIASSHNAMKIILKEQFYFCYKLIILRKNDEIEKDNETHIFNFFKKMMNERFSDDYQPVMTFSLKLNATIVNITKIEKNIYLVRIQGLKKWIAPSEFYCTYCERPRVISCSISQLITVSFGLWKISYFSTLNCNIIKYSRWIWSYKSNHIQSKSQQDRKVFFHKCLRFYIYVV